MRLKSCLVKSEDCNNLSKRYKVLVSSWFDLKDRLFDYLYHLFLMKPFCLTISDSQAVQIGKADANGSGLLQTPIRVGVTFKFLVFFLLYMFITATNNHFAIYDVWIRLCFNDIWGVVNLNSCSFWRCDSNYRCGYPAVNASYYDLSFHPVNSNHDCKLYKNSKAVKCYDCDSCK